MTSSRPATEPRPPWNAGTLLPWVLLLDTLLLAITVERIVMLRVAWYDAAVAIDHVEAQQCAGSGAP